jgi:hypothetical protein
MPNIDHARSVVNSLNYIDVCVPNTKTFFRHTKVLQETGSVLDMKKTHRRHALRRKYTKLVQGLHH